MSVIITEDRIKKILSNREKMLNDINKKMVLLFREVSRSDMGVFMDELIAEKSISAAHNSLLPGPKGGKKKDLSDLIIKLEKDSMGLLSGAGRPLLYSAESVIC